MNQIDLPFYTDDITSYRDKCWAFKTLSPPGYVFQRAAYNPSHTKLYVVSQSKQTESNWCV